MQRRSLIVFLITVLFTVVVIGCSGATSSDQTEPAQDDTSGRAVTSSGDTSAETSDEATDETSETPAEVPGEEIAAGDEPTQPIISGEINVEIMFDGQVHPSDIPLTLADGRYEIQFHITSTGTELAHYNITSAALPDLPHEDDIEGTDVTIPYTFTYNQATWGDWGIMITINGKEGLVVMEQVLIDPAPVPEGFPQ